MTRDRLMFVAGVLLVFLGMSPLQLRGSGDQLGSVIGTLPSQQPPVRDRVPPPQVGTATVKGRVIDGQTGAAVPRARVRLTGGASPGRPPVLTDEQGAFTFTGLPPGGYTVTAGKATYMDGISPDRGGSLRSSVVRPLVVKNGEAVDNVVVRLYHGGTITGRVVDAHGDPVEFAQVAALAVTRSGAGRAGMRGMMQTNDIGEFRISRLTPGRYLLMVNAQSRNQEDPRVDAAPFPQPVPTYFPNVLSRSEAQPVPVGRGQTVSGIEIAMGEGVPTVVTGRVIVADGQPLSPTGGAFVTARLDDRDIQGGMGMSSGGGMRPDGSFRFLLAPGNYTLEARRMQQSAPGTFTPSSEQFGMTKVSVAGETMDVSILIGSGATASGRVTFEGDTPPPPPPTQTGVPLNSPDGGGSCRSGQLQIAPDWTFMVKGLMGNCGAPTFGMFGRWTLKSVMINNQELKNGTVMFEPGQHYGNVQIVVTDRRNELNLHVTDDQGQPTRDYAVLVFSTDKSRWEGPSQAIRTYVPPSAEMITSMQAMATASGRGNLPPQVGREFVSGLTAGEYYAIALDDIDAEASRDPAVLERLTSAATRVTLSEGTVDVSLPRLKLNDVIRD
jgi:protocatechuate 3,4-dioxygenase beta subunit